MATNYEVITESPEKLVDFLSKTLYCDTCPCFGNDCNGGLMTKCKAVLQKWLASEAEE